MQRYDTIVVGSGISGMTVSLLLGLNGKRVLLLEKAPVIGGSMSRFRLRGVPFDTGFHFTGGMHEGGMLWDILRVLGMQEMVEPEFLPDEAASTFILEGGPTYHIPAGIERIRAQFKRYFPTEAAGIDRYLSMIQSVCQRTPSMDLGKLWEQHTHIDEDFISLQSVLDSLTDKADLKAMMSAFAMCYGVKPSEVSFASHARMCMGLYESMARVRGGGEAFIKAFRARIKGLDLTVRTSCTIAELAEINEKRVKRFVLSTGEEVMAEQCIMTIHPAEILKLIPPKGVSPAFRNRVEGFEPSIGFFSVFATLPEDFDGDDYNSTLITLMPHADVNAMLDDDVDESAILLIRSLEQVHGKPCKVLSLFEPAGINSGARWAATKTGHRTPDYLQYKARKTARILARIVGTLPQYEGKINVLDSASVLTFRDYLNSPDGSAYGVKQKIGQVNLRGELPIRNLMAAGQSSLLPGILGAMMSSFMAAKAVLDQDKFSAFMQKGLGR